MFDAFNYNHPERIPLIYHPSPAGLYVHGEKLLELFNKYPPDNPILFDKVPILEKESFDANGDYHQITTDVWGTDMEYRIFGIAGIAKGFPFQTWKEAVELYEFPPIEESASHFLSPHSLQLKGENQYLIFKGWLSLFEKLTMLHPFEDVLTDIYTKDEHLLTFLDKLVDYWIESIDYYHKIGTDVYIFGDDWGSQWSPIIDPELFREIFKPWYARMFDKITQFGGLPFFHCCGFMGEIFDELVDMGIRGLWHQMNLYEEDKHLEQKCKDNKIAVFIHPDRQHLIPLGTPVQIKEYIRRKADKYKKMGGGGIFYVEIENDAPFDNVVALFEAIEQFR